MSTTASGARISAAGRFDHSNRIPSRFRTRCRHPPAPLARPATRNMASGVVPRPPPSGAPPRIPRTRRTRGGLAAFASGACTAVRRVSSSAGSLSTSRASPSALPTKRIPAATSSGLSASGPRRTVTRRSRGCRRFGVALHPPRRSRGRARVPARPPVRGGGSSRCSPPRRSRAVCAGLIDPDHPLVRASDHGARARHGDQGGGSRRPVPGRWSGHAVRAPSFPGRGARATLARRRAGDGPRRWHRRGRGRRARRRGSVCSARRRSRDIPFRRAWRRPSRGKSQRRRPARWPSNRSAGAFPPIDISD